MMMMMVMIMMLKKMMMMMVKMMIKMVTIISCEGVPLSSRDWFASSIRFCSSWEFNNYNYQLAIEYKHMDF